MLTGYENTDGTVNEIYLLDKDSMLIDYNLRYDYAPISTDSSKFQSSKIREIKYPQVPTTNGKEIETLEEVLNLAFNSQAIKQYYHFDKFPNRKLLIADYFHLAANIRVEDRIADFLPPNQIESDFFIEFQDINQNKNEIDMEIRIHGEGVTIHFWYIKMKGKWGEQEPFVVEN